MKGDINPIIYAILAIVIVVALVAMFILRVGPFSEELNEVTCTAIITNACTEYANGNLQKFKEIPSGCSIFYPQVTNCLRADDTNREVQCRPLCQ